LSRYFGPVPVETANRRRHRQEALVRYSRFVLPIYRMSNTHLEVPGMPGEKSVRSPRARREPGATDAGAAKTTVALRVAGSMGLLAGPKTTHVNAKVPPKLFQAAAKRLGTSSPAAVINAALASLATEDELGDWLARNWGVLRDMPKAVLDQLEF
jgi:hypothetical protein